MRLAPSLRLVAIVIGLLSVGVPAAAQSDDLRDLRIRGDGPAWGFPGSDLSDGTAEGNWTAEPRLVGDRLRYRLTLTPPPVNPVLSEGPAALVTGVELIHGLRNGGDIGYGRSFGLQWTPLEPCTGDPCTFTVEVTVPLRPITRFIASVPDITSPAIEVGFTLVRTFGQGTWVQASIANEFGESRYRAIDATTPLEGTLPQSPVMPAPVAPRWGAAPTGNPGLAAFLAQVGGPDDPSAPVPTVTARLDLNATGCGSETQLQLFDRWNTTPFVGSTATVGTAGTYVALPDATDWSIVAWPMKIGEIAAAGDPMVATATVSCDPQGEVFRGQAVSSPAAEPLPAPPAPLTWRTVRDTGRTDPPARVTLIAAQPASVAVVERGDRGRWQVSRSTDGARWTVVRDARLPAAVVANAVDGLAMTAAEGRTILGGMVRDDRGTQRLTMWSSEDLATWTPATIDVPNGRPFASSLVLRSLVGAEGRWFALADADGVAGGAAWASTDGRTWTAIRARMPARTSLATVAAGPTRLVGVARSVDPRRPDRLVSSDDGRRWLDLDALPVARAATVSLVEPVPGTIVVALARSAVEPIELWRTDDEGATWTRTWRGSSPVQLDGLTSREATVLVAGSVRHGRGDFSASPWAAVSRDAGRTWRVDTWSGGAGPGRCVMVGALAPTAAVMTIDACGGDPTPRWRAALPPVDTQIP